MVTGTRTVSRDPRDPRDPRGQDYGYKTPLGGGTTANRNSLDEQTRKAIPDFVQSVDESRTNTCLRNHVYESPKFGQQGTMSIGHRPGGGPPVYHELDADNDDRCPRHVDH